jgi:hypothetical protein
MMENTTSFQCPNCDAQYKVVRVEAPPNINEELVCLTCGSPLRNREDNFVLKYFRTERGAPREVRASSARLISQA